jgi:hypothetical protein
MPAATESNFFGAIRKGDRVAPKNILDDIADKSAKKAEAKTQVAAFLGGIESADDTGEQFFWVTVSSVVFTSSPLVKSVVSHLLHSFRV